MKMESSVRNTCRLCGKKELELVLSLPPTPPGDHYIPADRLGIEQETYPLNMALCRSCGNVQLTHVVNPDILYGGYTYVTSVSLGLPEHFERYVDDILARTGTKPNSLVVDVGSNDGTLLRSFKIRGQRVLGIDPAGDVALKAVESGIETRVAYFTAGLARTLQKECGPAGILTANNVMANIDNLDDMVAGIKELLAPDGVFVFETGYVADLIKQDILDNIYHEHISYFAVRPLAAFFRKHGLELYDVQWVDSKGGSLRGFVQHAGGPKAFSPSVDEFIRRETAAGLDKPTAFKAFADRLHGIKLELETLLAGLRREGLSVAAFGASVGVTTMIYFFGLGQRLAFLADDNPRKHHLFSPGFHIPVLPSDQLLKKPADYVVILPWRYADSILKRHSECHKRGTRFIVPIPSVRTI